MLKNKIIVYHVARPHEEDFVLPVGLTLQEAKSFVATYFEPTECKTLYATLYQKQHTIAIHYDSRNLDAGV